MVPPSPIGKPTQKPAESAGHIGADGADAESGRERVGRAAAPGEYSPLPE